MKQQRWLPGIAAVAVLLTWLGSASADRIPSMRSNGLRSDGVRHDITVPYLTTGGSAFGAYSVSPRIYSSPTVNDPKNPQARPVFNLIFYGASQSFGGQSNGATSRPR